MRLRDLRALGTRCRPEESHRLHTEVAAELFSTAAQDLDDSVARHDQERVRHIDQDVDVARRTGITTISLFGLVALQLRLQELLNAPKVDVILRDSILPPLRERILAEALRVA